MKGKSGKLPKVVIIGGGFGGLYAAKEFGNAKARITLIDKRNFHLFQPLLYQVATGGLSPGDIASPLRAVLHKYSNIETYLGEVTSIDPQGQNVICGNDKFEYDYLILATGSSHHYFGKSEWEKHAPGIKAVEDALKMRSLIFKAFENADKETDKQAQSAWMTFVLVGGGPTGVELAGALGELARATLRKDFKRIDTAQSKIFLVEGMNRILTTFPERLSDKAKRSLEKLGVTVITNSLVTDIDEESVTIKTGEHSGKINTRVVLWAAGVQASRLGLMIAEKCGTQADRSGKIFVTENLNVKSCPNIFIIGDLAHFVDKHGIQLPGVAPVAMQQGRYAARFIKAKIRGRELKKPFKYFNKGDLAVIGRNAAIAKFGRFGFSGFPAWLLWLFVHIAYLIEYDNKLLVLVQWGWNYITRKRGARLITGENHL